MFRLLTNRKRPLVIEWFFFVKKLLSYFFFIYLRKNKTMTHYEDVKRAASSDTIDYLNARVKALENRVKYLENIIDIEYLNEEQ